MTALAAGTGRDTRNIAAKERYNKIVETSAKVYQGALVSIDSTTGRAQAAAAATGQDDIVRGIAESTQTGDTAGTVRVEIVSNIQAKFAVTASVVTQAKVGVNCYVKDDNTVTTATDAGTALVRVLVGELVEKIDTNTWWVHVGRAVKNDA